MAPAALTTPRSPAHRKRGFRGHHQSTARRHGRGRFYCLERPCACLEGWVFVGYIDEDGEERQASYRCQRCSGDELDY